VAAQAHAAHEIGLNYARPIGVHDLLERFDLVGAEVVDRISPWSKVWIACSAAPDWERSAASFLAGLDTFAWPQSLFGFASVRGRPCRYAGVEAR
jgi:hypothetical protein